MTDNELYFQILGLSLPWQVTKVELDMVGSEVRVYVAHDPAAGQLQCQDCQRACPGYDTQDQRRWRHLDTCQLKTFLISSIPRVQCPVHGVRPASAPWTQPGSRFTLAFERFAIAVLKATGIQAKAAQLLRLSPSQVHRLMHRAVGRGLSRRDTTEAIEHVGLDEKSFSQGHHYATILTDTYGARVIDMVQTRTIEATQSLLQNSLSPSQREQILSISMDMWPAFAAAASSHLPLAKVVHDRFHIAGYLSEAVDKTRRSESARLSKESIPKETPSQETVFSSKGAVASTEPSLKGSRYIWLTNPDSLTAKQKNVLVALCDQGLETAVVWSYKEAFRDFFACSDAQQAQAFFDNWYTSAMAVANVHLTKVAKMLQSHLSGLLAYITFRTTNAKAEAINNNIEQTKINARGFRQFDNFRIAVLFFHGKLNLDPQNSL